jgi:hypothetical protein
MKTAFHVVCVATLVMSSAVAQRATVIFHVVDESGITIPFRVDSFVERGRKLELSSHFADLRATDIPHGAYDYVLGGATPTTFGETKSGRVEVWLPENLVVVKSDLFRPYRGDGGPSLIRGRIKHVPLAATAEPVWIRLNAVYQDQSFDVPVDPDGEFRIYGLAGRYLLTVIRGDEVLGVQQVWFQDAHQDDPLVISLPDAPMPFLTVQHR